MKSYNYKKSLDLYERVNVFMRKHKSLSEAFLYQGYDLSQVFSEALFLDIRAWVSDGVVENKISIKIKFKTFIVSVFVFIFSAIGVLSLLIKRTQVLIYSVDKTSSKKIKGVDFRMEEIYSFLLSRRISFFEVFHTVPGKETIKKLLKRKRLAMYIETLSFCNVFVRPVRINSFVTQEEIQKGFNAEEVKIVERLLKKYLKAANVFSVRLRVLTFILKLSNVKTFLTIDDVRYYHELIFAAKKCGITTYAFQHGHFTKYHVGWLSNGNNFGKPIAPDKIFVWSHYWKNELLRLKTYFLEKSIVVGGTKNIEMVEKKSDINGISILIPYELDAPKVEVRDYILKMLECADVSVYLKLRADFSEEYQLKDYGLLNFKHARFFVTMDSELAIRNTNIVAGTYSTFLYDMIACAKPVVLLKTSLDFGEALVHNNLADMCDSDNLYGQLRQFKNTPQEVLKKRIDVLYAPHASMQETLSTLFNK